MPVDYCKWVNEARQGQQYAWNLLYNFSYPILYSQALHICGNTPAAKDAVQDSFLTAFLKLDSLNDPQAFLAWIQKITRHHCYRHIQKEQPGKELIVEEDHNLFYFEKKLDELNSNNKLFDCLERLPEFLKTTVLLRYFSRHNSYEEIAKILDVPVGTVRSRLNKARLVLSQQWKQSHDGSLVSEQSEQWNSFYQHIFEGYLANMYLREKMLDHIEDDLQVQLSSRKKITGKDFIAQSIEDDVTHGISLRGIQVTTCGKISVIEFDNINHELFPAHCPEQTALVVFRDKEKMTRIHMHNSTC